MALDSVSTSGKTAPSAGFFWCFTQVFDYLLLGLWMLFYNWLDRVPIVHAFLLHSVYTTLWINLRELFYKWMFPSPNLIAKEKLEVKTTQKDIQQLLAQTVGGLLLHAALYYYGYMVIVPMTSLEGLACTWGDALAMGLINDAALEVYHSRVHKSIWAYKQFHATHHESRKECSTIHAYSFDLLDAFMEFAFSQIALLPIKWMLGLPVQISSASFTLYSISVVFLHSANPHTVFFFVPFLDYLVKPTLIHSLHHAMPNSRFGTGIVSFSWANREKDIKDYQEIFGVDLGYGGIPPKVQGYDRKTE